MNINLEQSKKAAQASGQALYERLHVLMPELYPDAWEDLMPKYQRAYTEVARELESRAPAQAVESVAQWQSRLKDRSSPVVDHWVNISPDGAKTLMEKYANVYEVRALYTAAHAPAQPSLPALTDAMRAVLTNDAGAYQSADELYAALCKAAGAESPDREDALAVLTDDHAFALYMLARTTDDSKRWIKELRTSLTASQEQEQPKPRECRHCGWMCIPNSTPSKTWYPLAHQEQPYEAITRVDTFLREYSKLRGIDQKRIHAVNGEHELRQDDLRAILNCAITHSGGISAKEEDRS